MIYTELTIRAMKIAYRAHEGQVDKIGVPYIYHPVHLAEQMTTEDTCVAALLHDVVEDSDCSLDDLKAQGFTDAQIEAVRLLTHEIKEGLDYKGREQEYLDYVRRLKSNPIARIVTLADLTHNMDPNRIKNPTEWDEKRMKKYKKAYEILKADNHN